MEIMLDGVQRMEMLYGGAFSEFSVSTDSLLYVGGLENYDISRSFDGCIDLNKVCEIVTY